MKENTLILPNLYNIPSNSSPDFNSDLNSSRYLVNKNCNTKFDVPQFSDLTLGPHPAGEAGSSFGGPSLASNYGSGPSVMAKERESLKREYNLAFENALEDISNKRRNNAGLGQDLSATPSQSIAGVPRGLNAGLSAVGGGDDKAEKAMIDRITSISTLNVKKIMDLLSRSNSIKEFQTQLQSLILNLCVDLYKNNDEVIGDLQKRVDYLTDEKLLLSNLIKSQYHSIKKLKEDEYNVNRSEEENMMLKSELNKFKHIVNNMVYSKDEDKGNEIIEYINRKPPDVC